ncbi:MAG: cation transporter [Bacteroidales bacterium]|nr:cation transporter [Bacteroidales bacterium]
MENKLWTRAIILAYLTVIYNILEGLVSVYFGWTEDSLSLFGFGVDSFIETISASGIIVMLHRIKNNEAEHKPRLERYALRITSISFWILGIGLLYGVIRNIIYREEPISAVPGIIITIISIIFMLFLYNAKIRVGRKLNSAPIIADARCGLVCVYLSIVVLVASALYHFLRIPYIDAMGAAGVAYFSFKEGIEAFQKSNNQGKCSDCCA